MAWQSAALLLRYPCDAVLNQLSLAYRASHLLPDEVGGPLRSTVLHLESAPLTQLQLEHVRTFRLERRHDLSLSHLAHGDIRHQPAVLLPAHETFPHLTRSGADAEPPDHLCVLWECGAPADPQIGWRLLLDHQAGLERLRISLLAAESGWSGAVSAVSATLRLAAVPRPE